MTLKERLIKVIAESKECGIQEIEKILNSTSKLELDSLEIMQLVIGIEEEFNFEIDDQYLGNEILSDYDKLLDIIQKSTND